METEVSKTPEGTAFTLTVPLNRDKSKTATFFLREVDEETFMAFKSMVNAKKTFDAVRLVIKSLSIPPSDDVKLLTGKDGFIGVNAAGILILDLLEPLEGDLKKN